MKDYYTLRAPDDPARVVELYFAGERIEDPAVGEAFDPSRFELCLEDGSRSKPGYYGFLHAARARARELSEDRGVYDIFSASDADDENDEGFMETWSNGLRA